MVSEIPENPRHPRNQIAGRALRATVSLGIVPPERHAPTGGAIPDTNWLARPHRPAAERDKPPSRGVRGPNLVKDCLAQMWAAGTTPSNKERHPR